MSKIVERLAQDVATWKTQAERKADFEALERARLERAQAEAAQKQADYQAERQRIRDETSAIVNGGYGYPKKILYPDQDGNEQIVRVPVNNDKGGWFWALLLVVLVVVFVVILLGVSGLAADMQSVLQAAG